MCIVYLRLVIFVPCQHSCSVLYGIDMCVPGSIHPNDRCPNSVGRVIDTTELPNTRCRVCQSFIQNQAGAAQANNPIPNIIAGAVPVNNQNPPIMAAAQAAPYRYDDAIQDVLASVEDGSGDDFDFSIDLPEPAGESPNNAAPRENSLLDAEGETDPEFGPGGCIIVNPNSPSDGSDADTPVQQDDSSSSSSPSSSSSEGQDEGSLYEDSGRDESVAPDTERATTRSMARAALNNARVPTPPQGDGESDDSGDADDEASPAGLDIYDASP